MHKVIIATVFFIFTGCNSVQQNPDKTAFPKLTGKYFGLNKPTITPEIFAPNIISTGMSEINACYSPDYSEFLYTIILPNGQFVIMTMSYTNEKWSEPKVAHFSGKYSDADPFISYDGKWLYFVSKRPIGSSQKIKEDWDIWRLEKINGRWDNPEKLGSDINSSSNDIYPSLTKDGTLYYSSGKGSQNNDIYFAKPNGRNFEHSVKLSDKINSQWEGDIFISADESYMIFFVSHKNSEKSGLYISFRNNDSWSSPKRMGKDINRTGKEFCPIVSPDGKYFFFTSNRKKNKENSNHPLSYKSIKENHTKLYNSPQNGKNDIYWVDAKIIDLYKK